MEKKKLYLVRVEYYERDAPFIGGGKNFYVCTSRQSEVYNKVVLKMKKDLGITSIRIYPQDGDVID
jgi:hypothetical protein